MKQTITSRSVKNILRKAIHPELNKNLVELAMIRKVEIVTNKVIVTLAVPFLQVPIKDDLIKIIKDTIKKQFDNKTKVVAKEMNAKEKKVFGTLVKKVRAPCSKA